MLRVMRMYLAIQTSYSLLHALLSQAVIPRSACAQALALLAAGLACSPTLGGCPSPVSLLHVQV